MAATRVILVSDSHLSASAPQARANWDAVVAYVGACRPDLVIHLGDLSLDGTRDASDLRYARAQLDRLPVPWRAVPGNHDLGDNPSRGVPVGYITDDARRQRWLDVIGPDYWSAMIGGWAVLALDAQLLGSGLEAEAAQWSWLGEQADRFRAGPPVALITHKPITTDRTELAAAPCYRFWPPDAHDRLARLFGGTPPALVLSGHVHQYRLLRLAGTDHLWVPTTWAVLPGHVQPVFGAKRCGIVSLTLGAEAPARHEFVEPDGLEQLTLTVDLPDPYHG